MMAHWEQDFELRRCFTACHQAFRWNVSILLWIMRAWGRNVSKLTQCLLIFEFMVGGKNHGEKSCKWPGLGDLATIYRLWVAGLKIEDEKWNNGEKNGRKLANLFLFGGIYNWMSFFKFWVCVPKTKIPSEMEVAPRYKLPTLLTLFIILKLLYTAKH